MAASALRLTLAAATALLAAASVAARPAAAQSVPRAAVPAATPSPPSPAAATARDPRGLQLVPADAAAVVRADPAEIERAAEFVRSMGGKIGLAANLVSLASAGWFGFDPLARAGWRSIGIDGDQPVFLALERLDPMGPRAMWHVRLVGRVAQPDLFALWAIHIPLTGEPWRADRPVRGELARLVRLDDDARAEAELARALGTHGTISVGAVSAVGGLLFVRRNGPFAVLDLFAPADTTPIGWMLDGDRILAQLPPPGSGAALVDRTSAGARALAQPGLVFWTQPAGLLDTILVWKAPPVDCLAFRTLAPLTALGDAAASVRITPGHILLNLVWGAASPVPLVDVFAPADDGLIGPPLEGGAILAASLYLGSTVRLHALPRPALVQNGWVPFWRRLRPCGRSVRAVLISFGWPELTAQWLGDVAAVAPPAARLVGSIRNLGFAARRVSAGGRHGWQAVLEGSLAPDGQASSRAILDAIFGDGTVLRRPRPHTAWSGAFLRPYVLSRGKRGTVLGVAIGDDSRRWRVAQPLLHARRGARGTLARAAGDTPAILRQLAPGLSPAAQALAGAAAPRVGLFESSLIVQPDAMRASLSVRRR